jgi:translation initiation factor 4B
MASDGKKKRKQKGKTVALTEFLGNETPAAFVSFSTSHSSWAEETEDVNPDLPSNPWSDSDGRSVRQQAAVDRSMLPTAPRAAREQAALDMSRLPKEPPFTAFIGNLPYDCESSDIEMFFEKSNEKLTVKSVRLPKDVGGRLKGFGYAEFEDVQALIKALSLNDQLLKNRKVRVDIAGATQSGKTSK